MSSSTDHPELYQNNGGESQGGSAGQTTRVYCNAGPIPRALLEVPKTGDWREYYPYRRPESPRRYENDLFSHPGGYKTSPSVKSHVGGQTTPFQPSGSQVSKVPSIQDHPLNPDPLPGTSIDPTVSADTQTARKQPRKGYIPAAEVARLGIESNFEHVGIEEGKRSMRSRTNTTGDA
jgi:hypothetical protein